MKKHLLLAAFLMGSFFTAQAQLTLTLQDDAGETVTFPGAQFQQVSEAGQLTGALTSLDFDIVLEASTQETYASDFSVIVATGLTATDAVLLQAGGFSNFGADEHLEFEGGQSDVVGTELVETLTLATPITFTDSDNLLYIGNGYISETEDNSGTWSGTVTLNGLTLTPLAVKEIFASSVSVYPNPTSNVINITNTSSILVNNVAVVDVNGRTVKTVKLDGVANAQVNVSDLASGVYMVNISSDKGTVTKKIVKN